MNLRNLGVHSLVIALYALITITPTVSLGNESETLLQQLFRWLRPHGRYEGRLSDAVSKATEKSGLFDALPRVMIVDRVRGVVREWRPGRGGVDPVACPDGQTVFLRRRDRVESAIFTVSRRRVHTPREAKAIMGLRVKRLFACTHWKPEETSAVALWLQTNSGDFGIARVEGGTAKLGPIPDQFRSHQPHEVATMLRKLQGIRSDGTHAWVQDQKLLIGGPSTNLEQLVISGFPFAGDPTWLGDTDFVIVTILLD